VATDEIWSIVTEANEYTSEMIGEDIEFLWSYAKEKGLPYKRAMLDTGGSYCEYCRTEHHLFLRSVLELRSPKERGPYVVLTQAQKDALALQRHHKRKRDGCYGKRLSLAKRTLTFASNNHSN
jgi:hypothetical protein